MNFREWWDSPSGIVTVNRLLMAAMGLLLIGMSIAGIIMTLNESIIDVEWSFAFMAIYAYSGTVILLTTDRSPRFTIFLTGITYAVMNMVQQITLLQEDLIPTSILCLIMDFAMIISSILCLIGDRHSTLRLLGICMIDFATTFTAQMTVVLEINTTTFGYTTFWWMIVECTFLIVFMMLLLRPGIREESLKSRIRNGIAVINSMLVSEPSLYIDEKDVRAITGEDQSGWTSKDCDSPIKLEYTAEIHEGKRITYLTSYKWENEEAIRIGIAPKMPSRLYGNGFVMSAHSIEESEGERYLRLYGDDGYYLRILIKDADEEEPSEDSEDKDPLVYVEDKVLSG